MLEIRSILEGDKGFNSPAMQDFAHYVAQKLPDEFESADPLAQATEIANDIMFASLDAKSSRELGKTHPYLRDFILNGGDMGMLCREIAEVILAESANHNFTSAFEATKVTYFG